MPRIRRRPLVEVKALRCFSLLFFVGPLEERWRGEEVPGRLLRHPRMRLCLFVDWARIALEDAQAVAVPARTAQSALGKSDLRSPMGSRLPPALRRGMLLPEGRMNGVR
jgi:hypothetical protein